LNPAISILIWYLIKITTPVKKYLSSFWVASLATILLLSCQKSGSQQETTATTPPPAPTGNTLTDEEKASGWELLFDGSTFTGWKRYNADTIGPLWSIKDGVIICDGKGLTEGTANVGGSLTTK